MCGITGIISKESIDKCVLEKMTDTLVHRGPDGFGYYYSDGFAFGHRRLAIVDLSEAGHQPMEYMGRYIITYNGEVYNYIEIRRELEAKGYRFKSHTDTEVIMAAYDCWGVECLNRFNGMWAFVIYDRTRHIFFISRDRFGIKPLYYYQDESHFIFASEIKALLTHPIVPKKPNLIYCKEFLRSGPKEYLRETAFESIFRFDNACFLECSAQELFRQFHEKKFWRVSPNTSQEPFDSQKAQAYAQQYKDLLEDAVRLRLRADVKVGSALSGGLDSSSVVWLINQLLKTKGKEEKQETFSSVYNTPETKDCDEKWFIDSIAQSLSVKSNQIEPKAEDILEEHKKFVYFLDTPTANTLMSSWHTYKLTKACGVTVTLDGQGADEQLAGYLPYLQYYIANVSWASVFKDMFSLAQIPGAMPYLVRGFAARLLKSFLGQDRSIRFFRRMGKSFSFEQLNEKLVNDLELSLENLFHYADRGSMAFSVESRMPFMDYRLVEFLISIPATYKMHSGWTKYLARIAFNHFLPQNICWRKDKMGWPIPEAYWFKKIYPAYFVNTIKKSPFITVIDKDIQVELSEANINRFDFKYLTRCYVLSVWYEVFFGNDKGL